MRLFHGTSEKHLEDILENGLKPRGSGAGNWEAHPSVPSNVYMTDAYAGYFAAAAAEDGERWLVLEIDPDYLDHDLLLPDEDFIEQGLRGGPPDARPDWFSEDMNENMDYIRENLEDWGHAWELSYEHLGNVAYAGEIPPEAIVRYGLFDPRSAPSLAMSVLDPSISIMNYSFCSGKYKALTRFLVGDDGVDPSEMSNMGGFGPVPGEHEERWAAEVGGAALEVEELH